jgi:hypothetical protein
MIVKIRYENAVSRGALCSGGKLPGLTPPFSMALLSRSMFRFLKHRLCNHTYDKTASLVSHLLDATFLYLSFLIEPFATRHRYATSILPFGGCKQVMWLASRHSNVNMLTNGFLSCSINVSEKLPVSHDMFLWNVVTARSLRHELWPSGTDNSRS